MNPLGAMAVFCSVLAFAATAYWLRPQSGWVRWMVLVASGLLAVPPILFSVYYLHVLPERAWFYTFRSWTGTEFLTVFLGVAAGALACLLPRRMLWMPLVGLIVCGIVPHVKPLIGPLPDSAFRERWKGEACLQSTSSTCGPASVTTILRWLGATASEKEVARAAFSYSGGTEAWYLARNLRSRGFEARFDFRESFNPEFGLPAVVGVRLGSLGHFIAVREVKDDQVVFADPLHGEEQMPLSQFLRRYQFSGFHMVVAKRDI